jgi:hypothetical protein
MLKQAKEDSALYVNTCMRLGLFFRNVHVVFCLQNSRELGTTQKTRNFLNRKKRNIRTSPGVLLVFSCNGIDVIKKLHLCPFEWHKCNFLVERVTSMPFQENTKRCSSIPLERKAASLSKDGQYTSLQKPNKPCVLRHQTHADFPAPKPCSTAKHARLPPLFAKAPDDMSTF